MALGDKAVSFRERIIRQTYSTSNATSKDAAREQITPIYNSFMEEHGDRLNDAQKNRAHQAYITCTKGKDLEMSLKYILKTPNLSF
jgi:hypothetical protein